MHPREVRLGLVLYGGVSLAIYENGIVQEIYRAIRGDGVYGLIRDLIDSDIVVDVISGTSAGGVNGVMLAYALATQRDFLGSAARWRELGDIQKLLRDPDDKHDTSILSSEYYQEKLSSCYFDGLMPVTDGTAPAISELDLFVTGTDAHGVISTVYDDLGHPIDVKNHRAVFQLQYRGDRKNDFERVDLEIEEKGILKKKSVAVTCDDMATLSRLTSGFPVAFEPISIGTKEQAPAFHRWGRLSGPAVYMDGGILNNKPFTTTISAIASRTATREVERFLIYVEPSPEQFVKPCGVPKTPTIVEAGLSSLTSIPSYQSIAADLEAIEAHNERSLKVQKIVEGLGAARDAGLDCLLKVNVMPADNDPCRADAYLIARLLLIKDGAVEAILNSPDGQREFFQTKEAEEEQNRQAGDPDQKAMDRRRSGRLLVQSFWEWKGEVSETLIQYDVFFRKRRADYLTGALMTALKREKDPMEVPLEAWEAVNHFFKLYEISEWAMKSWLTEWVSGWETLSEDNPGLDMLTESKRKVELGKISTRIWDKAKKTLDLLMECGVAVPAFRFPPDMDANEARKNLAADRKTYYEALTGWMKKPVAGSGENLLLMLDAALAEAVRELEKTPRTYVAGKLLRQEFCRFLEVDRQLLPIQIGSGFESSNVVRVVRFSPLDAQRCKSEGLPTNKVRGTALANFGAFFKEGWRANDIMMGRLDAACLLTECLLTKERLTAVAAKPGFAITQQRIDSALPKGGAALTKGIHDYFAGPTPELWESMINAIVGAAHDEIVATEWPQVAKSTLKQQYEWGQYQEEDSLPARLEFPAKWTMPKAAPDELLVQIAAEAIHNGDLPPFDPKANVKKDFLDEVPLTAVQEHIAQGLVRLGKSLLASVPEGKARDAVKGNLIFKATMQWFPGYFYRLVQTRRTQPDWMIVPIAGLLNLALIAVLVLAWISEQKQHISLTYAILATTGVAVALAAEWVFTRKPSRMMTAWMVSAIVALAVGGFIAGYVRYRPASTVEETKLFLGRCILSGVLIALLGLPIFKNVVVRIAGAGLAGLVLLQLIWK